MKRSLFLVTFLALSTCAFADSMAWEATGNNQFGSLDLNTGAYTQIGDLGFTPAGLGEIGQTVYTAVSGGYTLDAVNTQTGAVTAIGNASKSYYVFGSTSTGLYMVDGVGSLWNINPTTGADTLIGSTHLLMGNNSVGLSSGSNNLYISLGSNIYTINTSTGLASYLGTSGSTDFGALVSVAGTIYASTIVAPNSLYTFNSTTNISTFNSLITGASDYAWGLAPVVPEPSSFALLGLGLTAALGVAYLRRRARA